MARILVVDDEDGIRAFLALALETDGHVVTSAADGSQALAAFNRSRFALVITDVKMPGPDGLELLERLRHDAPQTRTIVLTAHGTIEHAVRAMRLGAFDYVEKPLESPTALRRLVQRALAGGEVSSRRGTRASDDLEQPPPLGHGDPAMSAVCEAIERVARTDTPVLILGETGTGKEVAARTLHAASRRAAGPFVPVNCATLRDTLLESELFGHERGAFTGANAQRRGRLELAYGGTFFLDEIAELKPDLQAKLLRVLQDGRFQRVGGNDTLRADVRWVAATHRDLKAMLRSGAFREDLYHRLAVFPIQLPPLRDRPGDLRPLADWLLQSVAQRLGRPTPSLDRAALAVLARARLSGNVRELRNVLERAAILSDDAVLQPQHIRLDEPEQAATGEVIMHDPELRTLEAVERAVIERTLAETGGNRKRAALLLGVGLRTLYDKIKRYRLESVKQAAAQK